MSATQPRIAIIGAGRVGGALGALWFRAGLPVVALVARRPHRARAAAALAGKHKRGKPPAAVTDPRAAVEGADWIVLAVPDDDIAELVADLAAEELSWKGRVVLHTSGYHDAGVLAALADQGAQTGTLHPLQSVPSATEGVERIPGCSFAIDGTPRARTVARKLAKAAGGTPIVVEGAARPAYHAAAVLASNGLVALLDAALEVMTTAGLTEKQARAALIPLVRGTIDNVEKLSTGRALTGPVARGDFGTVEGHLHALEHAPAPGRNRVEASVAEIYTVLARRALGVRSRTGPLSADHFRLAKLLFSKSERS